MMKKIIYAIVFIVLSANVVCAQDYNEAFESVKKSFENRTIDSQDKLQQYLETYPYTPYVDEVLTMFGVLLSEKEEYQEAINQFSQVHSKNLSRDLEASYYFYLGYAHMQMQDYQRALLQLVKLTNNPNNPFTLQASYYAGYCHYSLKEYGKALAKFLDLEHVGGYKKIAPYYIVQIHFALAEYDKVLERATKLLADYPDNEYNDELHRMMGEIYYQDSIYDQAANHLEAYQALRLAKNKEILRNDLYLLGISNYSIGKYDMAINYLKQVKHEQDSISESVYLHLGHSYLRENNLEKAILAYTAALDFNINPTLREEAMYNYVQATYLQNSALGESIYAFQTFIKEYPCSKYIDKVYALMADMYLTSKNYIAALEALSEIQQPNEKVVQTCQYLRYQLAVDAYLQNKMEEVLHWTKEVIAKESNASKYKTEAYFLSAQAYYRLKQYSKAIESINAYEKQTNIAASKNKNVANYLKAYAHFNQKEYVTANTLYRKYIQSMGEGTQHPTVPDALNRLGDCLFHEREFKEAATMYAKVAAHKSLGADYALMQNGYTQGLMHQYATKVNVLTSLVEEYPHSDYADVALYEIARAELLQEHHNQAIQAYEKLLDNYPHSKQAAKASLEIGLTYRTLKQYESAIEAFKSTIATYIGSEEAYSALESMEQIYIETNQVDEYIAYTKTLSNMNIQNASREDSLVYISAELQYMMGNHKQAIDGFTNYIENFCPGGRYCVNATYYTAKSYDKQKQYDQAIEAYSTLAEMNGNSHMEEACMRVAELSYDKKEYRTALFYFQRMSTVASSPSKQTAALLGMLRCSHHITESTTAIDVATQLLEKTTLDYVVYKEALYCRAKAYIKEKQYASAVEDLNKVANEVRTAQGAEAKYLLAECHYHLNAMDTAENEIMSFTQQQTSHQYWLAKSLILLADINIANGDIFQAKQYLLALQKNYRTQDDIQDIIVNKLQEINQMEIQ